MNNICKIIAESLNEPCQWDGIDKYVMNRMDDWCCEHCGSAEYWKCWRKYFVEKLRDKGIEVEEV